MNKFTEKAKKVLGGSEVIAGLEKVENDLLIATYPDGITITGADMLTTKDEKTGEDKTFVAYTFAEDPTRYACGGKVLTDLFTSLMEGYPDAVQFSAALKQEGGIKVKLQKKKSRSNGQPYTAVEIVD